MSPSPFKCLKCVRVLLSSLTRHRSTMTQASPRVALRLRILSRVSTARWGGSLVWKCHQSKFELVADVPSLSIRSHKRQHCKKKMETKQPTRRKNRDPRCYTLYSLQRCRLPWRIDYSSGESDDLSRSNRTTRGGTLPGTGCAVTNGASGPTTDDGSSARHNWARPGQCISPYRVLAPRQRREFTWPMLYPSFGHLGLQDLGVACQKYMCNL